MSNPAAGSTTYIYFTTNAAAGAAVAPSSAFEAADVLLYKDGSATQRSSTSGWTMTSPFDSLVGGHQLAIDLSDNTDAGFYAAGHTYTAVLSPDETIDSQTPITSIIGQFTIGPADANLTQILGTAVTESIAAQLADAFTKWFDVTTPTGTVNSLPGAIPQAAGGLITSIAGSLDLDEMNVDVEAIQTRVELALPNAAPDAAGGLLITVAGSLDMDEMNVDIEAIQTRVELALPAAAPQAAGGLIISTAGSLDLDEMNVDVEAIQTRVELALPAAAGGAAGGVFIAGTNAPVTITGSGNALTLSSTGANGHGLSAAGNGSGAGLLTTGGATGVGLKAVGGSSSGAGLTATGSAGNAQGATLTGQGTGKGLGVVGGNTALTSTYALVKNAVLAAFPIVMTDATTGQPTSGYTVTAERSLDGGAYAAMTNAVVEIGSGSYSIDLAAADTNANTAQYKFTAAGANTLIIGVVLQS